MKKLLLLIAIFLIFSQNSFAETIVNPITKSYGHTAIFLNDEGYILTTSDNITYDGEYYSSSEAVVICPVIDEDILSPDCTMEAEIILTLTNLNLALLKLTSTENIEFDLEFPKFTEHTPEEGEEISINGFGHAGYEFTGQMINTSEKGKPDMHNSKLGEELGEVIMNQKLTDNFNWYFLTNGIMNFGNSGSPVFNSEKELIGITSAYSDGSGNESRYLIPPSTGNSVGYVISSDIILIFLQLAEELDFINEDMIYDLFSEGHIEKSATASENEDEFENLEIFTDIDVSSRYIQALSYLKDKKILGGYPDGSFKEADSLNRAELLKILVEASGNSPSSENYNNCFPDVKDEWFAKYVCFAVSQEWVEGYADGTFKPSQFVNKAEAIKMLMNTFNLYRWRDEGPGGFDGRPYSDVSVGAWYMQYIGQAQEIGLLEETGLYFYPGENITRGQISENIYRTLIILESLGITEGYEMFGNEKDRFLLANSETACMNLEKEESDYSIAFDIEQEMKAIFIKYGFNMYDYGQINTLTEEYEQDLEDTINEALEECDNSE